MAAWTHSMVPLGRLFTSCCAPMRSAALSTLPSTLSRATPVASSILIPKRNMIIVLDPNEVRLDNLRDNAGAVKYAVRVGRGIGTGTGKTSKKGHKGQKARTGTGKPGPGREGGQTPAYRTLRKFGFKNTRFSRHLQGLNLDSLQHHIDNHTINPYKKIGIKEIADAQCVGKIKRGVKILARGAERLTTPNLHLEVNDCSTAAREAIEKMGGKVELVYHNRLSLRYTVKPEKFFLKPTFARPPPKLHKSKYPNFPDPTPVTADPDVLDNLEYPPDFDAKRRAQQKARSDEAANNIAPRVEKKTVRQERKEKAIEKASAKSSATA